MHLKWDLSFASVFTVFFLYEVIVKVFVNYLRISNGFELDLGVIFFSLKLFAT